MPRRPFQLYLLLKVTINLSILGKTAIILTFIRTMNAKNEKRRREEDNTSESSSGNRYIRQKRNKKRQPDSTSERTSHSPKTYLRNPRRYHDYTVAVICVLDFEVLAVQSMLECEHDALPAAKGDRNAYILGELSGHNTVLTWLPGTQGKSAAARVVTDLERTFPSARLRLLVGTAGGVPSCGIHLGDVVVSMPASQSTGVVQYDLGKRMHDRFVPKGLLYPAPEILTASATSMKNNQTTRFNKIDGILSKLFRRKPAFLKFKRPLSATDILFNADYLHKDDQTTCDKCNKEYMIDRREARDKARVHYGLVASGDQVLKCAKIRDDIAHERSEILCFEMEAAGIQTGSSCIVIRGISNYADSHKNDTWQYYAAAAAAACAKELLEIVPREEE